MSAPETIETVLLTGATGRLGRVVCQHLHEAGYQVRATDQQVHSQVPVRVEIADLTRADACYRLCEGVQAVIHLANIPHSGLADAQRLVRINTSSNFNVFQAAVEQGARKLIFASSVQILGTRRRLRVDAPDNHPGFSLPLSERTPIGPDNPYALSKHIGEETLRYFSQRWGVCGVVLRFPWLCPRDYLRLDLRRRRHRTTHLPDYVAWLVQEDAASLCQAVLKADLPGYRVYLPSAQETVEDIPIAEFYQRWYQGTPLARPLDALEALVDIDTITAQTGWRPRTMAAFRAQLEALASASP